MHVNYRGMFSIKFNTLFQFLFFPQEEKKTQSEMYSNYLLLGLAAKPRQEQ